MRKIFGIIGTIGGIGLFLLTHAVEISNVLGLFQLPAELKEALIVLSNIPIVLAWGALSIGLLCAGYLVYDSGHHNIVLSTFRKWRFRVDPIIGIAVALVVIGLIVFAVRVSNLSAMPRYAGGFFFTGTPAPNPETEPLLLTDDGGAVKWGAGYILSASGSPNGVRISGIQATGENKSDEFVGPLSGYVRSEITGQQYSMVINDITGKEVPLAGYGIPAGNQFRIFVPISQGTVPLSTVDFMRDFGRFTFVFQYGNHVYTRRFSPDEVQKEIQRTTSALLPRNVANRVGARPMPTKDAQ